MNSYEMRQAARKQRLLNLAERLEKEGNARYQRARALAAVIPFGQPIIVGHHSEKRDRNYRERIHNTFGKAFEAMSAAREAAARAEMVGTGGISSDDPDAVVKLREQLARLEEKHQRMKAVNASHRAYKAGKANWAEGLNEAEKAHVTSYEPAYSWEPHPIPPYRFQNHGANMRRIQKRIAELEHRAQVVAAAAEINAPLKVTECGCYRVIENLGISRVQLKFPGKPPAAVREVLKSHGFRWAPSEGAWQRMLNEGVVHNVTQGYIRAGIEKAMGGAA